MPTVEELVLEYGLVESLVTVPPVAPGVCSICHGCPGLRYDGTPFPTCWSCSHVAGQLTYPCDRVVPVSLCRKAPVDPKAISTGAQLYDWLKRYKSVSNPETHRQFSFRLVVILAHFLDHHWGCITLGGLEGCDVMTVVPSTKPERAGNPHPLHEAMDTMLTGMDAPLEVLLQRGPGVLGRNQPSDDAFVPISGASVAGRRVLILDDTYTSGTTAQSAASALTLADADVAGIVPIGRLINPTYVPAGEVCEPGQGHHQKWWEQELAKPFSFDTCCIH